MSDKHILVASPVRQSPVILKEYAHSLLNLNRKGLRVNFLFIDDNIDKDSIKLLQRLTHILNGTIIEGNREPHTAGDDTPHRWDSAAISRVSEYRNRILQFARDGDFDGLFFVDSDLLLHPDTLRHLAEQDKDIIAEIYWTRWSPSGPLYPQVWLYDNYTQYQSGVSEALSSNQIRDRIEAFHAMLRRPGVYKVGGLGGCTLINKSVLKSNVSFTRIYNLSFAGEDRHFCVRAAASGFEMYVDTAFPAYHIYRSSDLKECWAFKNKCAYRMYDGI